MFEELSVEQTYQKKTQLEHILLRPDTYVGSIELTEAQLWVYNDERDKFEYRKISYVPGLYKIFDEILVNAADNYQRDRKMNLIKVDIDKNTNSISIFNNGKGIPVVLHKEHHVYVPELIFGHLLTSSNYDDTQKKITGGRNGYGAKLTNIFSTKFTIEAADSKNQLLFKTTWTDNMSNSSSHTIEAYKGEDYTRITFVPDLKRFGMASLDRDILALMKKRVYDLCGVLSSSVRVHLNGKPLEVRGFSDYVEKYLKGDGLEDFDDKITKIGEKPNDRWEVFVSISEGQFQQVSFVNSICTSRGGTHVNYITDQICDKLIEHINKKNKGLNIKPYQIKTNLWVFVNCAIENPAFDSQTKETLTTKVSQFGSNCELSEKFLKAVLACGVVDQIVIQAKAKQEAKMAKTLNAGKKARLLGIQKLEDANEAGTRNAEACTLILTEGDSAKSLAMAGLEVVGRDKFGVFPLKGKLLNVREATVKQITENQEIQHVMKIMGLQLGKTYTDLKSLRYGSIMIMADQDNDGSHIKGLIINFIHHFWPSLVFQNNFVKEFATPLIKATKGQQVHSFYTVQDFKRWAVFENIKTWKIKYYKGLGTSTDEEAREYFQAINQHEIKFQYVDKADDESIDLAFNKNKADLRKEWLNTYDPDNFVDHNIQTLRYTDFINKELIQFSVADNLRSIPSLMDGLKPGQRKILFACFKRNLRAEIKVAQLSGYIAEHSAYHHGEQSLAQAITGMAQNFVGANNINLLQPIGQFGSRNMGGKEAASARYIHTNLAKLTRLIYPEPDDHILKYLEDDGQMVEPEYYTPIIPMSLVNGAEGIGTGWSTFIPCYNPREIVENLRRRLKDEDGGQFSELKPWFKGFNGEIMEVSRNNYHINGLFNVVDETTLEITELPIRKWTRDYKTFLEGFMAPENGAEPELDDIREYHAKNQVHFVLKMSNPSVLEKALKEEGGLLKKFKLTSKMAATNMVLFNSQNKLQKYTDARMILEEFYNVRLKGYGQRKEYLVSKLEREIEILSNKVRFILMVVSDQLRIQNVKRRLLIAELVRLGFRQMKDMVKIKSTKLDAAAFDASGKSPDKTAGADGGDGIEEEELPAGEISAREFNYLLAMPLWSLTYEKVEEFKKELQKRSHELDELKEKPIQHLWLEDLDEFEKVLDEEENKELKARNGAPRAKVVYGDAGKKVTKKAKKKDSGSGSDNKSNNTGMLLENSDTKSAGNNDPSGGVGGGMLEEKPKKQRKPRAPKDPSAPKKTKEGALKPIANSGNGEMKPEEPGKEPKKRGPRKKEKVMGVEQDPMAWPRAAPGMKTQTQTTKPKNDENKTPGPSTARPMSLEERLKQREAAGEVQKFHESYNLSKSPIATGKPAETKTSPAGEPPTKYFLKRVKKSPEEKSIFDDFIAGGDKRGIGFTSQSKQNNGGAIEMLIESDEDNDRGRMKPE